ncbi:MAG TPA: hypothetical protein V6D47_09375 [Oscillatoriaceae cyanobacterium]
MPEKMTWRSVLIIWLLAVPFLAGVALLEYRKDPKPFYQAAAWTVQEGKTGVKAVKDYQAKQKAEAAAKKAAEEKAKKAAEAENSAF